METVTAATRGDARTKGGMPMRPRTAFPLEKGQEVPTGPLSASEAVSLHQEHNRALPLALQLPRPVLRALYPVGTGPTGAANTELSRRELLEAAMVTL